MAAFHFLYYISTFFRLPWLCTTLPPLTLPPSLPPSLLTTVHEKSLLFPLLPAACVFYIFGDPLLGWWLGKERREGGREGGRDGGKEGPISVVTGESERGGRVKGRRDKGDSSQENED